MKVEEADQVDQEGLDLVALATVQIWSVKKRESLVGL